MPAEAVHLSTLDDALARPGLPGGLRARLRPPDLVAAARLGAIFVDLPYFDRFPVAVTRYLRGLPQHPSAWGDVFHRRAPAAIAVALLDEARAAPGDGFVAALALGLVTHLLCDAAVHPLVNALARARVRTHGGAESRQHNEVEKYQSILFHEQRQGADLMGTPALHAYIAIDARPLLDDDARFAAVARALARAVGAAPSRAELRRFARGYAQYAALLASPAGKWAAPARSKRAERASLYEGPGVQFHEWFGRGVTRAARALDASWAYLEHGEPARAALDAALPAGSIDDPPIAPFEPED